MGWYGRSTSMMATWEDIRKTLDSEISDKYEIVKSAIRGGVYYAAMKIKETGQVIALVHLIERSTSEWSYKPMDELQGPHFYDCPREVFDLLTEVTAPLALRWRENVAKRLKVTT